MLTPTTASTFPDELVAKVTDEASCRSANQRLVLRKAAASDRRAGPGVRQTDGYFSNESNIQAVCPRTAKRCINGSAVGSSLALSTSGKTLHPARATAAWPTAICVALHPGTVDTPLSAPFVKSGLDVQTTEQAADRLLDTIDRLRPDSSGGFFDHHGEAVPW